MRNSRSEITDQRRSAMSLSDGLRKQAEERARQEAQRQREENVRREQERIAAQQQHDRDLETAVQKARTNLVANVRKAEQIGQSNGFEVLALSWEKDINNAHVQEFVKHLESEGFE